MGSLLQVRCRLLLDVRPSLFLAARRTTDFLPPVLSIAGDIVCHADSLSSPHIEKWTKGGQDSTVTRNAIYYQTATSRAYIFSRSRQSPAYLPALCHPLYPSTPLMHVSKRWPSKGFSAHWMLQFSRRSTRQWQIGRGVRMLRRQQALLGYNCARKRLPSISILQPTYKLTNRWM